MQNLLVLRFANSIFEPLWNQKYIDHVQITVAEEEGLAQYEEQTGEMIATRAGYYEGVGALRDMVQNHMLQVLCVVAMEPPWSLKPDVVRDAKSGVLNCLRLMTPAEVEKSVVRAQYIEGDVAGKRVPGYRKEVRESFEVMKKPLPPESVHSTTETFVALKLFIDNWRWAGVPFYLRTGKRLPKRAARSPSSSRTCRRSSSTINLTCRWNRPCCRCACSRRRGCPCASPRSCRVRRCAFIR